MRRATLITLVTFLALTVASPASAASFTEKLSATLSTAIDGCSPRFTNRTHLDDCSKSAERALDKLMRLTKNMGSAREVRAMIRNWQGCDRPAVCSDIHGSLLRALTALDAVVTLPTTTTTRR